MHSFDPDSPATTVVDRQIMDQLNTAGMVCLPLATADKRQGVLVLGLSASGLNRVLQQRRILELMAAESAISMGSAMTAPASIADTQAALAAPSAQPDAPDVRTRRIVHEVNNPLSIIRNYLQVLGIKLGSEHPALAELKIIEDELVRASGLIQQLTATSQTPTLDMKPVMLNGLVSDLVQVSEEALLSSAGVNVTLDLDTALPPILSDPDALKQVLINLIRNATEAMSGQGEIRIRTRDWFQVDRSPYVELEISDDGPGIPESVLPRLFQPVDSTKSGHSGLGLSIVRKLIESLDGSIGYRSGPQGGACFRILLPRTEADRRSDKSHIDNDASSVGKNNNENIPEGYRR